MCKIDESTGHGVYVCYSGKRDCAGLHRAGRLPENKEASAQKQKWDGFKNEGLGVLAPAQPMQHLRSSLNDVTIVLPGPCHKYNLGSSLHMVV